MRVRSCDFSNRRERQRGRLENKELSEPGLEPRLWPTGNYAATRQLFNLRQHYIVNQRNKKMSNFGESSGRAETNKKDIEENLSKRSKAI